MCGGQCQLGYISPCSGGYPLIGGGALGENLGSMCRQDSQTLSLQYTFVTKIYNNTFLNLHSSRDLKHVEHEVI